MYQTYVTGGGLSYLILGHWRLFSYFNVALQHGVERAGLPGLAGVIFATVGYLLSNYLEEFALCLVNLAPLVFAKSLFFFRACLFEHLFGSVLGIWDGVYRIGSDWEWMCWPIFHSILFNSRIIVIIIASEKPIEDRFMYTHTSGWNCSLGIGDRIG
ncbi:hypothetical protein BCR34DRAFT_354937 [Clohesyomyces aquaticus]|uniref:Uncharacterized protein n=1 Tax=Clohesyomyces aquaticus TaxID=1231657 RepID=A0A1Y1ZIS2_9PLEO|nr:hypothetical protein BCR34DRAFT_354937 [Clohesyomyces aquaticus]